MSYARRLFASLIYTSALVFAVSCSGLTLNPPAADKQTLLILPIELTNKTMSSRQGYYYKYRIENTSDKNISLDAVIKLPRKEGFMIVDSLPPGNYAVTRFSYHPIGGASLTGNNVRSRYDAFVLEPGKITIFSQTLHVIMQNETVGRMGTTYVGFRMEPTSSEKESEITQTLKSLTGAEAWEFM